MSTEMVRPLDAGWLWLESESNLMHGSVLALFSPPADAGDDFVDGLVERMRAHTVPSPPFDRRLAGGPLGRVLPRWHLVDEIDPEFHLRRVTLSAPGGQRELGQIVSSLHGTPLDHSRPPWMIHVIDGLEDGRFAVLGRLHHALADGITALRIMGRWLSEDPDALELPPIWAVPRPPRTPRGQQRRANPFTAAAGAAGAGMRLLPSGLVATRRALTGLSARPWSAPGSVLTPDGPMLTGGP
jgi:diacylglycerol O-acyltransferase